MRSVKCPHCKRILQLDEKLVNEAVNCSLCQQVFSLTVDDNANRSRTRSRKPSKAEPETGIPVWLIWVCIAAIHLLALIIFSMLWTPFLATLFVGFIGLLEIAVWQHKAIFDLLTQVAKSPVAKRTVKKLRQEIEQLAKPKNREMTGEPPIRAELAPNQNDDLVEVQTSNRRSQPSVEIVFHGNSRRRPGMWANLKGEPLRTDIPSDSVYFFGAGTQLDIGRGVLQQPLIYASNKPMHGEFDASLLDATLAVAPDGSLVEERLPYWPNYFDCSPTQRSAYLAWLLDGRCDPRIELGYVFIYFYGLERRVIVDQADHLPIIEEVLRLLPIYDHSNSFRNYATKFLWLALFLANKSQRIPSTLIEKAVEVTHRWDDDIVRHCLAIKLEEEKLLPAELAFIVAKHDTRTTSSVIVRRHGDKFRGLFAEKYRQAFGDGVKLRASSRLKRISYFPASATLHMDDFVESKLPKQADALRITSQFKPLVEIWDQCISELKAYSREHRKADGEMTAEAYEALPESLREEDHPELDAWLALWERYANDDGWSVVPVSEIAGLKQIEPRNRLTKTQCNKILASADAIGVGVEPDARLSGRNYKWDQPVCFFFLEPSESEDRSAYNAAAALLRLGLNIAEADGHIDQVELDHIARHLEGQFNLSENQSIRLKQLEYLLINYEGCDNSIGKFLSKKLTKPQRRMIGEFLVGVAAADEVIEASEVTALKKAWRSLDIDESELDGLLKRHASPIPVGNEPSNSNAPTPKSEKEFHLDMHAVSRIMSETREVAEVLQQAMAVDEEELVQPTIESTRTSGETSSQPSESGTGLSDGLPVRFVPFFDAVIQRQQWSAGELKALASEHGVMLNGAVEAINEWSTDEFGDWLIEEGEPYSIQCNLLSQDRP